MGTNFKEFGKELSALRKQIAEEITDVIKDVGKEVFTAVREPAPLGTPVVTGWARSGWRININTPTPGSVPEEADSGTIAMSNSEAEASLATFLGMKDLTKVDHIFVDNRVPYMKKLNYETAKQSPKLFVEKAIQRGTNKLNKKRVIK